MLIVGEKEVENNTVSVRKHGGEDLGSMSIENFAGLVKKEIENELNKSKLN